MFGFMQFYLKFSVLGYFLSLLGKVAIFFPSSLAFLSGRREAAMTDFSQGLLWRARLIPCGIRVPRLPVKFLTERSVHLHMWESKSRNWRQMKEEWKERQPLWCVHGAGEEMKGALHTLREPSLFSFQVLVCPPRSSGSGMLGLLTLVCLCSFGGGVWAELPGLLTANEMDLRGTINFARLFLSRVKP